MKNICLGIDGKESQFIFNDGKIKSRLINMGVSFKNLKTYYKSEWKYVNEFNEDGILQTTGKLNKEDKELKNIWFPFIIGTEDFLNLSQQEKEWAK